MTLGKILGVGGLIALLTFTPISVFAGKSSNDEKPLVEERTGRKLCKNIKDFDCLRKIIEDCMSGKAKFYGCLIYVHNYDSSYFPMGFYYDTDKDGFSDVVIYYRLNEDINSDCSQFPIGYSFDINRNRKTDDGEFLMDKSEDGFNGNEEEF